MVLCVFVVFWISGYAMKGVISSDDIAEGRLPVASEHVPIFYESIDNGNFPVFFLADTFKSAGIWGGGLLSGSHKFRFDMDRFSERKVRAVGNYLFINNSSSNLINPRMSLSFVSANAADLSSGYISPLLVSIAPYSPSGSKINIHHYPSTFTGNKSVGAIFSGGRSFVGNIRSDVESGDLGCSLPYQIAGLRTSVYHLLDGLLSTGFHFGELPSHDIKLAIHGLTLEPNENQNTRIDNGSGYGGDEIGKEERGILWWSFWRHHINLINPVLRVIIVCLGFTAAGICVYNGATCTQGWRFALFLLLSFFACFYPVAICNYWLFRLYGW
jgi:hypothetical protein